MPTKRTRNKRKSRRGGTWSWFKPKPEPDPEEEITEDDANRIALQIKQNVPTGDIPRYITQLLYRGKDSKKIKLALTKVLPLYQREKELFNFVYRDLERFDVDGPNERLRLFNADMEADEIIDYVQKGVTSVGIRYILGRSQNFMKLKSALTKKVALLDLENQKKFTYIPTILDELQGKKVAEADEKFLRNTRWVE